MAELGSHQLDAASLFIAAVHGDPKKHPHPLNVSASSSRPLFPADRDVEDHVFCVFEYPAPDYDPKDSEKAKKKIGVQYASINGNGFGGYGETVFGTLGTLLIETEKEAMLFKGSDTDKKIKVVQPKEDKTARKPPVHARSEGRRATRNRSASACWASLPAERGYAEELEHFAWCIRNPLAGKSAALPSRSGLGRCGDRADDEHGRPEGRADRVQGRMVRDRQRRNARRREAGRSEI